MGQTKKNKNKKSWWSFGGGSSMEDDNKFDDSLFNEDDHKMEYKVWSNLKKACHVIPNYEAIGMYQGGHDGVNVDEDVKEEAFKDKNVYIDEDKVMEIVNLGMGFTINQIRSALKESNNAQNDVVIDFILSNQYEIDNL